MLGRMQPYTEYKDSDLQWIDDLPAHWEIERAKTLFKKMDRAIRDIDEVVTCFRDGVVTLRKNRRTSGFTNSLKEIGYQGIRKGDLVIHQMDAFAGAVGVSDSDGKSTPVYSVCQPLRGANQYYYAFIVKEMARTEWIMALAKGIRERSTDFRYTTFAEQHLPFPPPDEQDAIVRFLDVAEKRIRRYIRTKQKLIKLLNEQKQAIIQQAVTRGLNPDAPMKDSGLDWLGEIPIHWDERPGKFFYREIDLHSATGEEELLSVSHITGVTPRSQKNVTMFKSASYVGSKICEAGDLVINTMWAWMGAMGVSRQTGIVSPAYGVYRPIKPNDFLPDFTDYLLRTQPYISEYICRSRGIRSSRLRLYPDQFLGIPIAKPPLGEQQAILDFLESKTSTINQYLAHIEQEIEIISEYRTRLIADVVTGKVDVRGLVFEMPENFDDDSLLDVNENDLLEDDELEEVIDGED